MVLVDAIAPFTTPDGTEPTFWVFALSGKKPVTGEVDCQLRVTGYWFLPEIDLPCLPKDGFPVLSRLVY